MRKVLLFIFIVSPNIYAADLYYLGDFDKYYSSPKAACADWYQYHITRPYPAYNPHYGTPFGGTCWVETAYVAGRWICQVITAGRKACGNDWMRSLRSMGNLCVGKEVWDDTTQKCATRNSSEEGRQCSNREPDKVAGNPITISVGNKFESETDYSGNGQFPLTASRFFNSSVGSWRFFPEVRVIAHDSEVDVIRIDGKGINFRKEGEVWVSSPDVAGTLISTEDSQGNIDSWTYMTSNDHTEHYNSQGRIVSVTSRNGMNHSYTYSYNRILESITVTHTNGNTLVYTFDTSGQIIGVIDPSGKTYQYSYDAEDRLVSVTYPDSTPADITDNPQRTYHYEDSRFPSALTSISDENGNRYATWSYDEEGRAISSEHANGVDKTTLTYNADGTTTVTNPLGKQTTYHFTTIHGVKKVTQVEGHPTASCEGANKSYSYDANGNIASKTDWNGITTNYTYDMDRNLELTRIEAVGTPQERTITTEWHADFRLPTKITEPGKVTEHTYDAKGRQLSSKVSSVQ